MNNVCLSTVTVKVVVASQYPDACSSLCATQPQLCGESHHLAGAAKGCGPLIAERQRKSRQPVAGFDFTVSVPRA